MSFANDICLVSFSLPSDEVASTAEPEPFFVLVPRVGYLPAFKEELVLQFSNFVANGAGSEATAVSFYLKGSDRDIPWHYPIGIHYHSPFRLEYP